MIRELARSSVADIEDRMRAAKPSSIGLLAVERKPTNDVIGYCGLVDGGRGPEEPELAHDLLRRYAYGPRCGTGTPLLAGC
jgi:[ribosomal protein S5]-alanine N-acetyltransferase